MQYKINPLTHAQEPEFKDTDVRPIVASKVEADTTGKIQLASLEVSAGTYAVIKGIKLIGTTSAWFYTSGDIVDYDYLASPGEIAMAVEMGLDGGESAIWEVDAVSGQTYGVVVYGAIRPKAPVGEGEA